MIPRPAPTGRSSWLRRLPLSVALAGVSTLLVLAAALGVSATSATLLRRFAEEREAEYAALAGRTAQDMVARVEDQTLAAAQLLAGRPTLAELLRASDPSPLERYLAEFCAPGGFATCAVQAGDEIVGEVGSDPGFPRERAASVVIEPSPSGGLRVLATAPLAGGGGLALVGENLDDGFREALGARLGIPVRILTGSEVPSDALGSSGSGGALRHVVPLSDRRPDEGHFLEVTLPDDPITASVATLRRTLAGATVLVVLLALGGAVVVSRFATRPLLDLTRSARRIGEGDLATPVAEGSGREVGGLAATMEDMRRRLLRATADLRKSEAEAQALLNGMVEGVFAVDEHRRIRYLNPQAASLLRVEPSDVIGRFCGDVLHPAAIDGERPCEARCPIVHARSRGSTRATEVLDLPGGRRRTVIVTSAAPWGDRQVQILRDETEVEGARRARDAIVASVSHEFRTPLSAQLASLELLRESLASPGGVGEAGEAAAAASADLVGALERSSLRLMYLVDNLLEGVRLDSGADSLRKTPVALDEVVEEATELAAPLFHQRSQEIRTDLPFPLPRVTGDPQRLTQVVVNLLANANKYSPPGSVVRIGGALDGSTIRIWVEDEGPGLPKESGDSIFDRFHRAADADTGGMGLGLWIVKSVVERHGGSVEALSLPEKGSRFVISLPTEDEA